MDGTQSPHQAQVISQQVARELQDTRQFFVILCGQLQYSVNTGEETATALVADLLDIDRSLAQQGLDLPRQSGDELPRLTQQLGDALARIQNQDAVRQQIGGVIQALQQLDSHTAHLAEFLRTGHRPERLQPAAERLQMLYDSYVSEQQRAIHNAALKREAPLFPQSPSPPELF